MAKSLQEIKAEIERLRRANEEARKAAQEAAGGSGKSAEHEANGAEKKPRKAREVIEGFNDRLELAILNKNVSQAELARQVGCSDPQIASWRKGESQPGIFYFRKLCESLNADPREMLGMD